MTHYRESMRQTLERMYEINERKRSESIVEASMKPAQIAALKKAYEPMRGGRISTDNATKLGKLMDKFDKDKDLLIQLFKADIPFVSSLASTRLITRHNMKGAEINKLKEEMEFWEELELDEKKILVANPKTQEVIKIDEKDWPKYEKKGYVQAEETDLDEEISKSTMYGVVVKGEVIAKGSKAAMSKLAKQKGGHVLNSPAAKVGDSIVSKDGIRTLVKKEEVELDEAKETWVVYNRDNGKAEKYFSNKIPADRHRDKLNKKYEASGNLPYAVMQTEETELDEEVSEKDFDSLKKGDTVTIEYKSAMSSGTATFNVTAKNVVGKAKVGKVTLQSTKNPKGVKHFLYKRGNKVSFAQGDMGASVVSFKKEEVELDEGKMKAIANDIEAYIKKWVKTHGDLDKDDFMKVASMLRKGDKSGAVKYAKKYMDTDPRDKILDMMGEEVELDEATGKEIAAKMMKDKTMKAFAPKVAKMKSVTADDLEKMLPDYVAGGDIVKLFAGYMSSSYNEASARRDAMRAMRSAGEFKDKDDDDMTATDADVKAASKNILMQMRKASNLGGKFEVEFLDKKKVKVKPEIANAFIKKYEDMRKPADKEKFQNQAMKSYKDMLKALKDHGAIEKKDFMKGMMKAGYNEETILDRITRKLKENKNG